VAVRKRQGSHSKSWKYQENLVNLVRGIFAQLCV